ncbi:MAG: phytanoyl-CoA dioxygenase family protein [Alphaproteobacteria bacterium]
MVLAVEFRPETVPMPKVLTETDVANFHTDGYHVPVPVMNSAQALAYRKRLEQFEFRWPEHFHMLDQGASLLCPWIDEMTRLPGIIDPIAEVLGPNILCWGVSLRLKEPHTKTYAGWHQDTAYCDIKPISVIAAVALSDCSEAAGPLRVIPGSHKGPTLPHAEKFGTESLLTREQEITAELDTTGAVSLPMAGGDMVFFNNAICHSSGPNQTADRRIIFLVEYVPTHASQNNPRESAMLVRGQDRFHNFDEDPRPEAEMSEAAIVAWRRKVEVQASVLYRGAKHPPRALVK